MVLYIRFRAHAAKDAGLPNWYDEADLTVRYTTSFIRESNIETGLVHAVQLDADWTNVSTRTT